MAHFRCSDMRSVFRRPSSLFSPARSQRCFADYTSALEALQAEQRASETHGAFGAHAAPRWADTEERSQEREGHRDVSWGDTAARHFHDSLAQADRARM